MPEVIALSGPEECTGVEVFAVAEGKEPVAVIEWPLALPEHYVMEMHPTDPFCMIVRPDRAPVKNSGARDVIIRLDAAGLRLLVMQHTAESHGDWRECKPVDTMEKSDLLILLWQLDTRTNWGELAAWETW